MINHWDYLYHVVILGCIRLVIIAVIVIAPNHHQINRRYLCASCFFVLNRKFKKIKGESKIIIINKTKPITITMFFDLINPLA